MAHEINNPLAIINEKAGLLKDLVQYTDNFSQKDKVMNLAVSITGSVDRCSKVTHRLLGFAKRMEDNIEVVDLKLLLHEVVGFQNSEINHRNLKINFDITDDLPTIESDRGQLQQVFLNIINNALAAVEDGGEIHISVTRGANDKVAVSITDNGSGIAEENLQHIFEPFYSTKGQFGTGLGLSITRDIVNKLGGTIDVQSVLGEGTRFIIMLPLVPGKAVFRE